MNYYKTYTFYSTHLILNFEKHLQGYDTFKQEKYVCRKCTAVVSALRDGKLRQGDIYKYISYMFIFTTHMYSYQLIAIPC